MKWDLYKKMNNSQRLYWEYNFNKNHEIINITIQSIAFMLIILLNAVINILKNNMGDISVDVLEYVMIGSLVIVILHIPFNFILLYKENKWLKQEGLK